MQNVAVVSCFNADFLSEVSLVRRFLLFCKTALYLNRASVFYFGLITILLWFCLPVSSGQESPQQPTVPKIPGVFVKSVPGAPFSATVEFVSRQKLPDGSVFILKTINHIARDSVGRTHNEARRLVSDSYKQEPILTDIHIYDPETGLSTHLDPFAFIARQTTMRAPPVANAKSVPDPNPNVPGSPVKQVDNLGTRIFKDLTLHGTRQSRDAADFDEYWYSPDFSIFMSRRHQDPVWEQTVNVTEFNPQEPDPSNFAIPAGYKIVEVKETLPAPDASGIYHVGNGVLPPQMIYAPNPKFSPQAREAGYGGVATVSLIVDAQGNPQNVHMVNHLKMGLDEEALAAVKQYKFKPATLQGKPVPVEVNIEINFKIQLPAQPHGTLQFAQPMSMPGDRVEHSYEIYSLLLKSGPIEWRNAPRRLWLIEDTTNAIPLGAPCRAASEFEMNPHIAVQAPPDRLDEWNGVLAEYDQHCHDVIQLDAESFKTALPVRLLNAEDKQRFMKEPGGPSAEFADAGGLHRFTEVFFNANHTLALVEQGMWCGSLCGNWTWVVLERKEGRWQILPWVHSFTIS